MFAEIVAFVFLYLVLNCWGVLFCFVWLFGVFLTIILLGVAFFAPFFFFIHVIVLNICQ